MHTHTLNSRKSYRLQQWIRIRYTLQKEPLPNLYLSSAKLKIQLEMSPSQVMLICPSVAVELEYLLTGGSLKLRDDSRGKAVRLGKFGPAESTEN